MVAPILSCTREKFITQLTLLSQLRNLDDEVKKIIAQMPITIDLRENALVKDLIEEIELELQQEKEGRLQAEQERRQAEQGRLQAEQERLQAEQTIKNTIHYLHQQAQMPAEQIATIVQLDLADVEACLSTLPGL